MDEIEKTDDIQEEAPESEVEDTEVDDAKAALEATESAEELPEQTKKQDGAMADMRRSRDEARDAAQAAEVEKARLEGKLEALESQKTTEAPELSPIEKAIAAESKELGRTATIDDIELTGQLYTDQESWKDEQREKKAKAETAKTQSEAEKRETDAQTAAYNELRTGEMSEGKLGEGLGLEQLLEYGAKNGLLLREEIAVEAQKAKDSEDLYKRMYRRVIQNAKESDSEPAKILLNRIKTQSQADETEDEETKRKPDELPTRTEILTIADAHINKVFGV